MGTNKTCQEASPCTDLSSVVCSLVKLTVLCKRRLDFDLLYNGKFKRFRNRQTRHNCAKKKHGQPGHGYGICHIGTRSKPRRRVWKRVEGWE